MKQIIIFLLLVIAGLIGYGQYSQYKRFTAKTVNYRTLAIIDENYHNKEVLLNYESSIQNLNNYIKLEWTANDIDVRAPKNDDIETKNAVATYSKKLALVQFYESILVNSKKLKDKGATNKEIKFIEIEGISIEEHNNKLRLNKIKSLFNPNTKLYNGSKNAIIFEVQKELNKRGHKIQLDGVYRLETLNAIKAFETENNLFSDGLLDDLTIEMLFQ